MFDIKNIFFTAWGYAVSHLEFWATVSGAVAVWLSMRENVWSWVVGILNVILAFIMFFQIQLYPDVFLQIFFFVTNIIGFYFWKYPKESLANSKNELKITTLDLRQITSLAVLVVICTALMGTFSKNLHQFFPNMFSLPSAFPYMDSFTTVASIAATFLLMKKKIEAWSMWLIIDVISTYMYFVKGIKIYSILYLVFCGIALAAALEWRKTYRNDT
jgi:nicotinamide mononucleotide transporter